MPEELTGPKEPEVFAYLWEYYLKLSKRRENNGFGVSSISPQTITAWMDLLKIKLEPWEIELICELDDIFVEVFSKDLKKAK